MKEGWEYKKLGEVCNVIGGGTPDTKNKEYWRGNIPWATVSDMNCDVIKTTGYYITDRGLNESSSRIIKKGEIVIATRVGLGKVCKLAVDTAINQDLKGVIPKDNNIVRDFIFYYFKHKAKYIVDNGIGATVKGVKIKFIEGLSFGFPSLSEQQSIVDYLDAAFAKIDAMKANAEKALGEAKALFQASLKEMLEPKEGWEEKRVGDVIDYLRTGLNPRTHFKLNTPGADGYYITVRELKGFAIEPDNKTDRVNAAAIKRINERSNLKIGDVLFSGTGTIGKTALVSKLPDNWNIKEGVYAMTPKHSELDSKYFIYYIGSDFFLRLVNDKAAGTGVRSIPMKELVKLPISVPHLSEQQSIVATLDSLKSKVDKLQENYDKISQECDALKQAILRQVFD